MVTVGDEDGAVPGRFLKSSVIPGWLPKVQNMAHSVGVNARSHRRVVFHRPDESEDFAGLIVKKAKDLAYIEPRGQQVFVAVDLGAGERIFVGQHSAFAIPEIDQFYKRNYSRSLDSLPAPLLFRFELLLINIEGGFRLLSDSSADHSAKSAAAWE